jgi:hypothetical protein
MVGRGKLTVLAAMSVACGGTTAVGPPGDDTRCDEVHEACAGLANAACGRLPNCGALAGAGQRFVSETECRERWELACTGWLQVPDGKIALADVAACSAQIEATECGPVSAIFLGTSSQLPWCLRIPGMRKEDALCTSDAQCATSFCGVTGSASGTTKATCRVQPPEPAYENQSCGDSVPCASTLTCEDGRCGRTSCGDSGCYDWFASCGGLDDPAFLCRPGTECAAKNDRGTGRCVPYAVDGQACGRYDGPTCLFPARCIENVCTLPEHLACR